MIPGVDHQSLTWRALKKHINERIADLQRQLEAPNGRDYTNLLRGAIMELRGFIAAVEIPISEPGEKNTETPSPLY